MTAFLDVTSGANVSHLTLFLRFSKHFLHHDVVSFGLLTEAHSSRDTSRPTLLFILFPVKCVAYSAALQLLPLYDGMWSGQNCMPAIQNRITKKPAYEEDKELPGEAETDKAERLWGKYLCIDNSPITDLFGGQLQSTVHCHKCKGNFTTYEPFWDLSLPIVKEGKGGLGAWLSGKSIPTTIQDCLQAFTADEVLQVWASSMFTHVPYVHRYTIEMLV